MSIFFINILLKLLTVVVRPSRQIWKGQSDGPKTNFALSHNVYVRLIPIMVFLLTFSHMSSTLAALLPGENGPGYPVEGTYYYHQDMRGNTVALTDDKGDIITAKISYLPYGEIDQENSDGSDIIRAKYTGKELDKDTGLYYFGARYYDPSLGVFITPEGNQEFFNPYLYVGNNPTSMVDPDGNFSMTVALVAAGIGLVSAYLITSSYSGSYNPADWNWSLGSGTYASILIGGAIGASSVLLPSVAGARYGATAALGAEVLVGAAAGASLTALSGGSPKEIIVATIGGAILGGVGGIIGEGLGSMAATGVGDAARIPGSAARVDAGGGSCTSGSCRCSFPAGTLVAVKNKLMPIETIKIGDKVWAYNEQLSKNEFGTVTATMSRIAPGLMEITIGKEIIKATPEHPFWVEGKGWVKAEHLKADYELKTQSDTKVKITKVTYNQKSTPVYNFSVAQLHNYYVGQNKLLVHNCAETQSYAEAARTAIGADDQSKVTIAAAKIRDSDGPALLLSKSGVPFTLKERGKIGTALAQKGYFGRIKYADGVKNMHAEIASLFYILQNNVSVDTMAISTWKGSHNSGKSCNTCWSHLSDFFQLKQYENVKQNFMHLLSGGNYHGAEVTILNDVDIKDLIEQAAKRI